MREFIDRRIWHKDFGLSYWCSICGEYKPESSFYKNNRTKWGVDRMCKEHYKRVKGQEKDHLTFNNLTRKDVKSASILLQSLGYDITKNIHEQFLDKHKDKLK